MTTRMLKYLTAETRGRKVEIIITKLCVLCASAVTTAFERESYEA
jgi:hypothetical protein